MTFSYTNSPALPTVRNASNEQAIVSNLLRIVQTHNVSDSHSLVTRFYVTLKSCSSLLLVGPEDEGKLALVESVAQALVSDLSQQYQMMVGHAYWASRSRNISLLVEGQASLNAQKLLWLLEEAARPKNADRLFIACLARISPAEVFNIFSMSGLRLFQGGESIPFPPNIRLIGTLDSAEFHWWIPELLSNTSVLQWPKTISGSSPKRHMSPISSGGADAQFLAACVRDEQVAYSRLMRLLGKHQPFPPLTQVIATLHEHGVDLPIEATNRAVAFLANAWTQDGEGLFASSTHTNLGIALDLALAQYILPWARVVSDPSSLLFRRLSRLLNVHGLGMVV